MKFTNTDKALREFGVDIIELMGNPLKGTSLITNIKVSKVKDGFLSISMPEYGKYVDSGRKAGKMPSTKSLEPWAKSKSIPLSALFPIARSIGENGTKGKDFLKYAHDEDRLIDTVGEALALDITNSIIF